MQKEYVLLDIVDSTNAYAKSSSGFPEDKMTVIRAKRQTDGRGRNEKAFFSGHEGGLWVSLVTPISDISTHFEHNRAISLAILETLKSIDPGAAISIKWPNDVYWGDRKICGILLENISTYPNLMIVGFGVNVNIAGEDFPEDLRGHATSILMETGSEYPIDQLLDEILDKYQRYVGGDQNTAHLLYSNNLYKKGCPAAIDGLPGTFISVDPDGRLRFETDRGHTLFSTGTLRFDTDSAENSKE